jgi:hypothetical protein
MQAHSTNLQNMQALLMEFREEFRESEARRLATGKNTMVTKRHGGRPPLSGRSKKAKTDSDESGSANVPEAGISKKDDAYSSKKAPATASVPREVVGKCVALLCHRLIDNRVPTLMFSYFLHTGHFGS